MSTPGVQTYLRRLQSVEGWLRPEAAVLVSKLAAAQDFAGSIGEIGIHHGKLFVLLSLLRHPGEKGVAVDLFEDQGRNVDGSGYGDRVAFEQNLRRFGAASGIAIEAGDSTEIEPAELLGRVGDARFRLFSIDGGHTAEITASDLALASAVLAPGGLVILDDYYNEAWPGVAEGTNRYLAASPSLIGVGTGHGKTFLTNDAQMADRYRDVMREAGAAACWTVHEAVFFANPHVVLLAPSRRDLWTRRARTALMRSQLGRAAVERVHRFTPKG